MYVDPKNVLKKADLANVLERVCQALDLTDTQHELAKSRYEAVGTWIAEADDPLLRQVLIYPHGSSAIGTAIKPLARDEHDVDLMSFAAELGMDVHPNTLKTAIGNRLRANGLYRPILEEKPRCWRLNYAGEFHLDITPSIKNPGCSNGGELVPDKKLQVWKPSNPKGYKAKFDRRAAMQPRLRMLKAAMARDSRADEVAPFPDQAPLKGVLRRTVQLAKRHRDVFFQHDKDGVAPISIIITTLAMRSYEFCIAAAEYDSELDLLCEIVRHMPDFIEMRNASTGVQWFVWNETTAGENFAEKWNSNPALANAFFVWHKRFLADLEGLPAIEGLDTLTKSLSSTYGSRTVTDALQAMTRGITEARSAGKLAVAPAIGLRAASGIGTQVRQNTFFGA